MTLVSVVVPVLDGERYLEEALHSVLAQTHRDLELIVVDDGSTDGSAAIAARIGEPVRLLSQAPLGPGAARNHGVARARGEAIAFLDADDLWEPAKLELQLAALDSDPSLDMVLTHGAEFLSPDRPDLAGRLVPRPPMPFCVATAALVWAEALRRVGPFATDLTVGEWMDWYARASERGLRHRVLPEVLVRRRLHGDNMGIRERASQPQYLAILKAAIDRRRSDRR